MLFTSLATLLVLAAPALGGPARLAVDLETRDYHHQNCVPEVSKIEFPTLYWTFENCIEASCTSIVLAPLTPSNANRWYSTGTEISTANSAGVFCAYAPSAFSALRDDLCSKTAFSFSCESCPGDVKSPNFASNCSIISGITHEGVNQCSVGHPNGQALTLGICAGGSQQNQLFNLIAYSTSP